jgi:hypothetical protein
MARALWCGRYSRALVSLDLAAMAAPESRKGDALLFYADGYKFLDVYHRTRPRNCGWTPGARIVAR